jgi:hypothetical protein
MKCCEYEPSITKLDGECSLSELLLFIVTLLSVIIMNVIFLNVIC